MKLANVLVVGLVVLGVFGLVFGWQMVSSVGSAGQLVEVVVGSCHNYNAKKGAVGVCVASGNPCKVLRGPGTVTQRVQVEGVWVTRTITGPEVVPLGCDTSVYKKNPCTDQGAGKEEVNANESGGYTPGATTPCPTTRQYRCRNNWVTKECIEGVRAVTPHPPCPGSIPSVNGPYC